MRSPTISTAQSVEGARLTVSVVVPTRGRPSLLARAVTAVLEQRFSGRIECLVVFDQSRPVMPPVGIPEGRELRVLTNERTPSLAGARNTGALAATGELIAFCDDDDEWLPDKLRLQVETMTDERVALSTCGLYVCYGRRQVARLPSYRIITHRHLLRSRLMEVNPSTIVVRRNTFLNDIGLVDEVIPGSYAEDYEWLLRATKVTNIHVLRKPLVRVYWHPASWFAGRWQTMILALTYLLQKYPEFQEDRQGLARIYGQVAFAYAALGERGQAQRWTRKCLSLNPLELRGFLSLLVSRGLIDAEGVIRLVHVFGRGI